MTVGGLPRVSQPGSICDVVFVVLCGILLNKPCIGGMKPEEDNRYTSEQPA